MQKIKLTQHNLKHFFSPVGPLHSHHTETYWPYDFVDRNSKTLYVTIGDSWTWGSGIITGYIGYNAPAKKQEERKQNLYGNIITKSKNYDWLNIGGVGQGNYWIADKVFELRRLLPRLEYNKVVVHCVLTSVGRWFGTWQDSTEDHRQFFQSTIGTNEQDYENFLVDLNRKQIAKIQLLFSSVDNVEFYIGTNVVELCGTDQLPKIHIIDTPWYHLLTDTRLDNVFVDIESTKYLPNIENYLTTSDQKFAFQKWMMKKIEQAETQHQMLGQMLCVAEDKCHPNAQGHETYAKYILENYL